MCGVPVEVDKTNKEPMHSQLFGMHSRTKNGIYSSWSLLCSVLPALSKLD